VEVNHPNAGEPLGAERLYQKADIKNKTKKANNTTRPLWLIISMQMSLSVQPINNKTKTK